MRKLTQVQASKMNTLKLFIPWYEKEYGSRVFMADNDVTYGWTLYNIWQDASGIKISVDGLTGGKRTERIDRTEISKIYSAVRRGEGDSFKVFVNEVLNK
jgi:hypothetical protein